MTTASNACTAVGYLRVSTDRQAERGFGLDVQEEQIRQWCASSGLPIAVVFADEGVSGASPAAERAGLTAALNLLQAGGADVLVVARLDRLARSVTVQEACVARIWSAGARLVSCDTGEIHPDDAGDPMRTAMRQMAAVFGQLERATINQRLREGRRRKAELGGYAYGAPPFGWVAVDGALRAVEHEQQTLRRVHELRAAGHSLRAIAAILVQEGCPPKRGATWHPQTVARALRHCPEPLD